MIPLKAVSRIVSSWASLWRSMSRASPIRGVGPTAPPQMIFALNFFASVKIAEALRPLLKKKQGNCVVTSSNSITNMTVRMDWVDMLSNVMDEERILEFVKDIPRTQAASCYSSSKHALARWVRRVSPSWAVDGLRINSVAPRLVRQRWICCILGPCGR